MRNVAVIEFFIGNIQLEKFKGKSILEVGSKYANESVRPFIERFLSPKEYIGVDIEPGKLLVINNMKKTLRPHDYWRNEIEDMRKIFTDFEIITLIRDHEAPGVFLKARKPLNWRPRDLSNIALYSMILGRRTKEIPSIDNMPFSRRFKFMMNNILTKISPLRILRDILQIE